MLRTDLTDHRGTDDARLVRAVADGDAIALAEAYHRTVTAAHACARRLLASPVEVEALMRSVYAELWEEPPIDEALEAWVRQRSFALGSGYLRQRGLGAPSPSLAAWTPGVDADGHVANDPLEQLIGELPDEQQAALIHAHDQGVRTAEQDEGAGEALRNALLALAEPLSDAERHAAEMCSSGVALANWIFGLLPPHEAATVPGTAAEPTPCGRLAGVLRRARRRFEPLPPTPDLGHRVLAWVLSNRQPQGGAGAQHASSLDADLRVASSDLDPGVDERRAAPRSSLDMDVPAAPAADVQQPPVTALRRDESSSPGWARPEPDERPDAGDDAPTPLRAPSGPPALAGPGAAPVAFGNAAPALVPAEDDEDEDLVRMPLQRSGRPSLASALPAADDDVDDTRSLHEGRGQPDSEAAPPPPALRRAPDATAQRSTPATETAPNPLSAGVGERPAPSPLPADEQRHHSADDGSGAESPLRRPAPRDRDGGEDRGHTAPADATAETPRLTAAPAPAPTTGEGAGGLDATVQTPVQRDDSDPRVEELFRQSTGGPSSEQGAGQAAHLTAPTLPAARRPTPQPTAQRATTAAASAPQTAVRADARGASPGAGTPGAAAQGAATTPGRPVPVSDVEPEGGNNILRWLVVLLLIAAGAAVGIFLGQMLI